MKAAARLALCFACAAGILAAEPQERFLAPYVFIATGSGVLVSTEGEVLTNHHVIAGTCSPLAPELTVRLAAGGEVRARLIATDPVGDLALLRLDERHPPLAPAALATAIPPAGSPVVAVGNPFALGDLDDRPSVSRGVLSTGRVARGAYPDCLQHDAAVNPGNSGGPLFDPEGALLGINGAIRSRSGFRINSGIGLAISAPQLARFLPVLRAAGSAGGWVHRTMVPAGLTLEQRAEGVFATKAPAPLAVDDRLVQVDGRPCPSLGTAQTLFTSAPWVPGATVRVRVLRAGAELDLDVPAGRSRIPGRPWNGFSAAEANGALVVERLIDGGPAAVAGLRQGEALLSADGAPLAGRLDLLRATAPKQVGDRLALRVRGSDGAERAVVLWYAPEPEQER